MRGKLMIQRLGIEFENFISDKDTINKVNEIVMSNKDSIKTLII